MSSELATTKDTFGIGVHEQVKTNLIATFFFGQEYFGVDALKVQEIVRQQRMTPVPHSHDYILGLINLRGQIVTALDLKYRLTAEHVEITEESMNIILKTESGICSAVVDEVGDVLEIDTLSIEPPPDTMNSRMKAFVQGVCKLDQQLLCILDCEAIVKPE